MNIKPQKRKQHGRDSRLAKRQEQARTAQQQIHEHLKETSHDRSR